MFTAKELAAVVRQYFRAVLTHDRSLFAAVVLADRDLDTLLPPPWPRCAVARLLREVEHVTVCSELPQLGRAVVRARLADTTHVMMVQQTPFGSRIDLREGVQRQVVRPAVAAVAS